MEDPFKKRKDYELPVIAMHQTRPKSLSTLRLCIYLMVFIILAFLALNPCNYMGDGYYVKQMETTADAVIRAENAFYQKNQAYTDDTRLLGDIEPVIAEHRWISIRFLQVSDKGFTFSTEHQNKKLDLLTFDQNGLIQ